MRNAITREGRAVRHSPGDTAAELALLDEREGCETLVQRVLTFDAGVSRPRREDAADEVLYVLGGRGQAAVADERVGLAPGVGLYLRRGTTWTVDCTDPLELVSVLVRAPQASPATHGVVDLAAGGRRDATAARQFTLGVRPEVGCASVTQFIGYVPVGRAPDHFHRYDEVLYVLAGDGLLHIDGDEARLGAGVCVHLPAGLVHCLENTGPGELELLGVFRPAGSPAAAYYPDGTPAPTPPEV